MHRQPSPRRRHLGFHGHGGGVRDGGWGGGKRRGHVSVVDLRAEEDVSCTSIKARPISTASALPPCHRTCAAASLQAVAGLRSPTTVNVHPSVDRWTAFNRFVPEWQDHCLRPTCLSTKVQSATLPQRAKGTTFTSASPSLPLPTPLAACATPMVIHDPSSPALHTGFIRATA